MLSHVEINVRDLERSISFWEWLLLYLGYKPFQRWDSGKSWIKDKTYIVFVQTADKYLENDYHRCKTGLNHIAFYASSKEEIDFLTEQLRARGVRILYEDRHPHAAGEDTYALFFEDPDRIKVEVVLYS